MNDDEIQRLKKLHYRHPPEHVPICYHCKYFVWNVGIGMGIRCKNPNHWDGEGLYPPLHSWWHRCEFFEKKVEGEG